MYKLEEHQFQLSCLSFPLLAAIEMNCSITFSANFFVVHHVTLVSCDNALLLFPLRTPRRLWISGNNSTKINPLRHNRHRRGRLHAFIYSRCGEGAEREREMRELATAIDFLKGHSERERESIVIANETCKRVCVCVISKPLRGKG